MTSPEHPDRGAAARTPEQAEMDRLVADPDFLRWLLAESQAKVAALRAERDRLSAALRAMARRSVRNRENWYAIRDMTRRTHANQEARHREEIEGWQAAGAAAVRDARVQVAALNQELSLALAENERMCTELDALTPSPVSTPPGGVEAPTLDFVEFVKAITGSRYQWVRQEDAIDMAVSAAYWYQKATGAQFQVNGEPVTVGHSLGQMRRLVKDLGALEDELPLTMPRPWPPLDLNGWPHTVEALREYVRAAMVVAVQEVNRESLLGRERDQVAERVGDILADQLGITTPGEHAPSAPSEATPAPAPPAEMSERVVEAGARAARDWFLGKQHPTGPISARYESLARAVIAEYLRAQGEAEPERGELDHWYVIRLGSHERLAKFVEYDDAIAFAGELFHKRGIEVQVMTGHNVPDEPTQGEQP